MALSLDSVEATSTDSLINVSKDKEEPTQKTQPKKGEPIEIPIPTESQIKRDFEKIASSDEVEETDTEN